MKRLILKSAVLAVVAAGVAYAGQTAYAHGYVSSPASRSYQGMLDRNSGVPGWGGLYGGAAAEPQSMEGRKNFPVEGPADGTLPSGGLDRFSEMNRQSATMWKKQDINSGLNTFKWTYTATHRTSKWTYWITKNGWNPNAPIKRSDLQLIGTVEGKGAQGNSNPNHQITVPTDHSGYHVILAVWDVFDTGGAFYQAIDVNVKNGTAPVIPEAPAKPEEPTQPENPAKPEIELPTAPSGLHSMGTTSSSVDLMWTASTHSQGIKTYEIYRNGQKVGQTTSTAFKDTKLKADTEYRYTVKAIAKNGKSADSNVFSVKTSKAEVTVPEKPTEPEKPAAPEKNAWDAKKVYLGGEVVSYAGKQYKAKYWTQNNRPDTSSAWEQIVAPNADGSVDYIKGKAYVAGNIVNYNGRKFQAKWWTTSTPGSDSSWKAL